MNKNNPQNFLGDSVIPESPITNIFELNKGIPIKEEVVE